MRRIFGANVFAAALAAVFLFFTMVATVWSEEQAPNQNQNARSMYGCHVGSQPTAQS